ncbi:hypothetical protein ACFW6N_06765 [Streptomyces cyaneofuscatus]|uniref:hypothetical protein n=1 Tax=Streptomyces cyaneofuscatus TaxID=66883 RepID=UPI003684E509
MSINLADLNIRWTGTDDTTPNGHVLVLGTDSVGNLRLCLYEGTEPDDAKFRGSLLIPPMGRPGGTVAYGPAGGHVTSIGDQTSMLARLANLAQE